MARYKYLIGSKLRARSLPAQQGEAAIAVAVLNTMIRDDQNSEARLRKGRICNALEGPAQPQRDPCTNADRPTMNAAQQTSKTIQRYHPYDRPGKPA